jgi:hypothetical protein
MSADQAQSADFVLAIFDGHAWSMNPHVAASSPISERFA